MHDGLTSLFTPSYRFWPTRPLWTTPCLNRLHETTGLNSADGINGCSQQYHHIGFLVDKQFCDVPRQMVRRVAGTEQGHALTAMPADRCKQAAASGLSG